jgi:hypothetical protein
LEIDTGLAQYGHTAPVDPMAGFEEIMGLQPWLKPGHKHQQGNPDRSKDNPHKVGPENLSAGHMGLSAGNP